MGVEGGTCVHRYKKYTVRQHSRRSTYTLSLSLTCGRRGFVCPLSLGVDLDYVVRRGGGVILRLKDTHTHFFLLSQISTHFHTSTSHDAPPQGHIMSRACDKSHIAVVGGGGGEGEQTVRLAGPASAGVFVCLCCLCLTVSFSVLTAAADLSFPRGLCERTEM